MSSKGEEFGSVSLSAEEIAAVLADTYYDADLIRQDSGEDAAAERESIHPMRLLDIDFENFLSHQEDFNFVCLHAIQCHHKPDNLKPYILVRCAFG